MEKEFFENALKQKRYQNNMVTAKTSPATDEPKGQSSSPGTNVDNVVGSKAGENETSNHVEFFQREVSESPEHGQTRSPIIRGRYPMRSAIKQSDSQQRRVPNRELATI